MVQEQKLAGLMRRIGTSDLMGRIEKLRQVDP